MFKFFLSIVTSFELFSFIKIFVMVIMVNEAHF